MARPPRGEKSSLKPNGNIRTSSFVKQDPSATGFCLQATTGDMVWGISGPYTRRVALDDYDSEYAGVAGDPAILIYGLGETQVLLRLGGSVTNGDLLKPDANGYGVVANANLDKYGARALMSGNAGELIGVEVLIGERSTT
jgi:hypothetical protein